MPWVIGNVSFFRRGWDRKWGSDRNVVSRNNVLGRAVYLIKYLVRAKILINRLRRDACLTRPMIMSALRGGTGTPRLGNRDDHEIVGTTGWPYPNVPWIYHAAIGPQPGDVRIQAFVGCKKGLIFRRDGPSKAWMYFPRATNLECCWISCLPSSLAAWDPWRMACLTQGLQR
jgi:hypothetical protein